MEGQLFVRIRGRVQGPYELEKLRALVRRGQLSRMHEVSSDGNSWTQAASYSELFVSPTNVSVSVDTESLAPDHAEDNDLLDLDAPPTHQDQSWHYAIHNEKHGPVTFEQLRLQIASGSLQGSDRVWTDGMKDWVPASSISGLMPIAPLGGATVTNTETSRLADTSNVERTLSESRPWVKFIAFCAFACGLLSAAFGTMSVVMGSRAGQAAVAASGFMLLLYAAIFVWGGQLLVRYNGEVNKFLQTKSVRIMDSALRRLRTIWMFCSIILIVILANGIVAVIWVFSIGLLFGDNL